MSIVITLLIVFIVLTSLINKDAKRGRPWHPAVIALSVPFLLVMSMVLFVTKAFIGFILMFILLRLVARATSTRYRRVTVQVPKPPRLSTVPSTASLPHTVEPRMEFERDSRDFSAHLDAFLREVRTATHHEQPVRVDTNKERSRKRSKVTATPDLSPVPPTPPVSPSVEGVLREFGPALPQESIAKIRALGVRVDETTAYLKERHRAEGEHAFLLKQTVEDYLPGVVKAYTRLPKSMADSTPLDDGKTGKDLLLEQLDLLDRGVTDILTAAAKAEGQDLLANGRFLKDRFEGRKGQDFEL